MTNDPPCLDSEASRFSNSALDRQARIPWITFAQVMPVPRHTVTHSSCSSGAVKSLVNIIGPPSTGWNNNSEVWLSATQKTLSGRCVG
jgi:hypothetical protein